MIVHFHATITNHYDSVTVATELLGKLRTPVRTVQLYNDQAKMFEIKMLNAAVEVQVRIPKAMDFQFSLKTEQST